MKAGVTINRPPRDGVMAFVRSPDKHSIELLQKGARRRRSRGHRCRIPGSGSRRSLAAGSEGLYIHLHQRLTRNGYGSASAPFV